MIGAVGRGYLLPMGMAVLLILLGNVIAVVGWGNYFPWSIPALFARTGGNQTADLELVSYAIVFLTGLAGIAATYLYWHFADQSR